MNVVLMKLCIVVIPTCPLHFLILPCTEDIGLRSLLVPCHVMEDCTCSLHIRRQTLLSICTTIVAFIALQEHCRSQDSGRRLNGCIWTSCITSRSKFASSSVRSLLMELCITDFKAVFTYLHKLLLSFPCTEEFCERLSSSPGYWPLKIAFCMLAC